MPAAFFDFDGTLFDTRGDLAATVNHARRDFGLKPLPLGGVIANVGLGAKYLLTQSFVVDAAEVLEEVGVERLFERFMSHYLEHACETVVPYDGVASTLAELRRRGVLLGINTAKPRAAVDMILGKFGLRELFGEAIVAAGDSPEMKPSARPLLDCAAKMPHPVGADDWMVGDNWTDVGCGQNAGVKSAYCDFGFGTLRDFVPTVRLAKFSDLLELVR